MDRRDKFSIKQTPATLWQRGDSPQPAGCGSTLLYIYVHSQYLVDIRTDSPYRDLFAAK